MQIVLTIVFSFVLRKFFFYYSFIVEIISFCFVISIINKNTSSVTKVSWIILLLVFPIVGVSVYLLSGKDNFNKNKKEKYNFATKEYISYCDKNNISKTTKEQLKNYYGLSSFIYTTNKIPPYLNTDCKYLKNGEEYFKNLIKDIKNAKNFIFLEYFIISKGKIWNDILDILKQKINENIEVFIIYDDLGSIAYLEHNFNKKLQKMGIKCVKFNKFMPILSIFQNCRNHTKLAVIDNKVAYVGGINIGDEYCNIVRPLKFWKDSGVRIEGNAVSSYTLMFLKMYCYATKEKFNFKKYLTKYISNSNGIIQPYYSDPNGLDNNLVAQNIYKYLINNAKNYLYISSPYVVIDYGLINDIIFAVKRGVDVRIVIPKVPDKKLIYKLTKLNCAHLIKKGVMCYSYSKGFIHQKNIVCDNEFAVVGSVNLDYRSFLHQFENGVLMYGCGECEEIKKDFEEIFSVSKLITQKDIKFNLFEKIFGAFLKIIAPLL